MRLFNFAICFALIVSAWDISASEWQPFPLQSYDGRQTSAELMMLPIRENRSVRQSRFIRVAVLRLPGHEGSSQRPPVVFLSGGPGIPATALARVPVYFDLFESLRSTGDVLLVDQRGSGMSLPNLICPPAAVDSDFVSSDGALRRTLRNRVAACSDHWRSLGVDLQGYSTREIAADVDAVRRAAGARKVNLVAFSYGSEVAFEILHRWPYTVSRVVLASTRAPDTLLKSPGAWDAQIAAIGELASFPLVEKVKRLVSELDAAPVQLTLNGAEAAVGGIGLLTILRSDLGDGRAMSAIPRLLEEIEVGRYETLSRRLEQLQSSLAGTFNVMTLAVDCSSGWSSGRLASTQEEARRATMRNVNLQWDPEICEPIVGTAGTPAARTRVRTPVLFLTGSLDPNAPAAQTEELRKLFSSSEHVIVENGAHETLPASAVQQLIVRFLSGEASERSTLTLPSPFARP